MKWNHQKWGTLEDPIHKSHLTSITGQFGCPKAFQYQMTAGGIGTRVRDTTGGKSAVGNAAHETIARALSKPELVEPLLRGAVQPSEESVRKVFDEELARAADGRELRWAKSDRPDTVTGNAVTMVTTLLADVHQHVAEVVQVEAGFIAPLGKFWTAGHMDLIYRTHEGGLAFCDWKTGETRAHPIELEHSFEGGLYANALHSGHLIPRDRLQVERWDFDPETGEDGSCWRATSERYGVSITRPTRFAAERAGMEECLRVVAGRVEAGEPTDALHFGQFPEALYHVHLKDYVPYQKKGSKAVDRAEDLAFYGLSEPGRVTYVAGDRRGPAWYPMTRTEHDVPRLEHQVQQVAGVVRMGRFYASIDGNKCSRCAFKGDCLTSGYELRGDDADQAKRILDVLPKDAA